MNGELCYLEDKEFFLLCNRVINALPPDPIVEFFFATVDLILYIFSSQHKSTKYDTQPVCVVDLNNNRLKWAENVNKGQGVILQTGGYEWIKTPETLL